ncbi:hypothetical protein ACFXHA_05385 [Nocardia sp. NPDC059240]|uniref:hypothetical protein n=1 Tax=Nocardia sp. NPDC059240 TaxID=3346786 RepID=UPI00367D584D
MTTPIRTTSSVNPVSLRQDVSRDDGFAYWAGTHADIMTRLPNLLEYVQRHFSYDDHGYWPATRSVGTLIPPDWRLDGFPEVRLSSTLGSLNTALHLREIIFDEQNVFDRVLEQLTGPGGGRWWAPGHDNTVPHRTAVLLQRRRGVSGRAFRGFVHEILGPALHSAGALDLRTYTFLPFTKWIHPSPGVNHDYATHRRFHGSLTIGAESRDHLFEILASPQVSAIIENQSRVLTAAHAYTIDRTISVILDRRIVPADQRGS